MQVNIPYMDAMGKYTIVKVDGDRRSQVRWQKITGHDKARLMGVATTGLLKGPTKTKNTVS